MPKLHGNLRINLFIVFVALFSGLILYRLFILSVIRHSAYSRTAQAQSENINNILARGNIYMTDKDSNLIVAATNKKFPLIYAVPADIKKDDRDSVAEKIAGITGLEKSEILQKINSDSKSLRVLARRAGN